MKTLLRKLFLDNWQRKLISLILAIIIWFMVHQSLVDSRTIPNVPVRVINIPPGKTIMDLKSNGRLAKRVPLTLEGNKAILDELTPNDLEIVIDAQNKREEWIASISKRNVSSTNPNIDFNKHITRVAPTSMNIRLTKLCSEKIPIYITQPIGEAPKDYQYLDVWPYQLTLKVNGPEEVIRRLKAKGIRLTFNLNDVSKAELDALHTKPNASHGEEVSFFVPEQWKRVDVPLLSDTPIEIDDPRAKDLRIDFVRISLLPITTKIPLSLYFPTEKLEKYNPKTVTWGSSPLIEMNNDIPVFSKPLYTKGVSHVFLRIVEQMLQLSITVDPSKEKNCLNWSIEFINPRLLEDRYVSLMMSDVSDNEVRELQPLVREEYLRNRFQSYMNRFQLYTSEEKRLKMNARLEHKKVIIEEGNTPLSHSKNFRKEHK